MITQMTILEKANRRQSEAKVTAMGSRRNVIKVFKGVTDEWSVDVFIEGR